MTCHVWQSLIRRVEVRRASSAIVEATGLSQPNVSNQLACPLDCGLVEREQPGRFAMYHRSDPRVDDLVSIAEALLVDVARGVAACGRYGEVEDC